MRLPKPLHLAPIALSMLAAACHGGGGDSVSVDKAWVRLAAVPGRPAAAYVVIHGGKTPARLIAIDSAQAGSSELHRSLKEGGMMSMQRMDGLDIAPGSTVDFVAGGYHAMLFGIGPQVVAGAKMPLNVRFAKGDPVTVSARVIAAGDSPPY